MRTKLKTADLRPVVFRSEPAGGDRFNCSEFRDPSSGLAGGASVLASRQPGVWASRLVNRLAPPRKLGTWNPEPGTHRANHRHPLAALLPLLILAGPGDAL